MMNDLATFTDKLDSNLVQNADGVWCMSSLASAELTGKRHDNVLVDIRAMFEELEINAPEFSGTQIYGNNNTREVFNLPKHECMVLVTGYSVKLRSEVLKRWQLLEDAEAERQQAALAEEREARAKLQKDYNHLSFQIITSRSAIRADIFDWKLRFIPLIHAASKKPDMYGRKHTPSEAVAMLAPYAEEAMRLIELALQARPGFGTALLKSGVEKEVAYRVLQEYDKYLMEKARETS